MKIVCLHMGRLLERRQSGLSAAEGLRLEEHLTSCVGCRADAGLLDRLTHLASETHVRLGVPARERAIANAFAASSRAHAPSVAPPRRLGLLLLGAAVALLALVVVVQRAPHESADRVLSGAVQVSGSIRRHGETLGSQVQLHTREGAVVALGHARVELRADSQASWDGATRKLDLQRGSALIDVDPAQHRSFQVDTQAFTVMVLGTRFEVTQNAVQVIVGRVAVQPKAKGADAAAIVLAAGSQRTRFELQPAAAEQAQPAPEPTRSAEEPRPAPAPAKRSERHVDANALLDQARTELAARELSQARATLKLAGPHLRSAALRAQALSLEAECELQAQRFAAARDTYLQVSRRFSHMPAAETALFAAARIETEHGSPARAATLFSNYLAKYPHGSYVREAERRLKLLPRPAPEEPTQ